MNKFLLVNLGMALILITTCMVGCGQQSDSVQPASELNEGNEGFDGSQWKLVSIAGKQLIKGSYISLYFRGGTIWGWSGLNIYGAEYSAQSPDTFVFSGCSMTLMGGPENITQQEKDYIVYFQGSASYRLEDNRLEISDTANPNPLVFERLPEYPLNPADLVGTKWQLVSVNDKPIMEELTITLSFDSDSRASGTAGCFTYELPCETKLYSPAGDDIRWGISSRRNGELPLEQEIIAVCYTDSIALAANYRLTGDRLEIFTARGDTLIYKPLIDTSLTSTVTCTALAIYLDHPYPGEKGIDYTKTPIIITGFVSSPEAKVTVNGIEAEVSGDGTYSATIRLKEGSNSLQAIATLGEQFDEITYIVGVNADGKMYAVPGLGSGGPRYDSRVLYEHSIELKAGETKSISLTLEVKKDIRGPELFTYTISRTSGEYSEDKLAMPEGLEVDIEPSELTVCPNTTYVSLLTIRASTGVAAGEYHFILEQYLENGFRGSGWIRINVTP